MDKSDDPIMFANIRRKSIIKWTTLIVLVVQNSGLTLTMRYSRIASTGTELYISSTAVLLCELIKLILSVVLFYYLECNSELLPMIHAIKLEFTEGWRDFLGLTIPSGLYVIQNNLQYIASSNLPAAVFQVLAQMKIITTAIFAVLLLGRRPTTLQWSAIVALTVGIACVNSSQESQSQKKPMLGQSHFVGVVCILCGCCTSGFAGIYFERMVKSTASSIWIRNIQMSLIGTVISALACIANDIKFINRDGFFRGYNSVVWIVILLQAVGGLVVAMVVKYADNILKGFATSGSIVISCVVSAIVFQDTGSESDLNGLFVLGASIVCLSAFAYGYTPSAPTNMVINSKSSLENLSSMLGRASPVNGKESNGHLSEDDREELRSLLNDKSNIMNGGGKEKSLVSE